MFEPGSTDSTPELLLAIVKNAILKFNVSLDEIHNDSTTVRFNGECVTARERKRKAGRDQPNIGLATVGPEPAGP